MKRILWVFVMFLGFGIPANVKGQDCHYKARYDLNGDCRVNLQDFVLLAQDWLVDCLSNPVEPGCIPLDLDEDGYDVTVDCDDNNPDVYPGAAENCSNQIDDDCDGLIDQDDPDCIYCGNGVCEPGEDNMSCPDDCPAICGDDYCDPASEDAYSCPDDCGMCGDGYCDPMMGEDPFSCPQDCGGGGLCGDGYCDSMMGEDPFSCPQDCEPGINCGDGICHPDEVGWCPQDCPW